MAGKTIGDRDEPGQNPPNLAPNGRAAGTISVFHFEFVPLLCTLITAIAAPFWLYCCCYSLHGSASREMGIMTRIFLAFAAILGLMAIAATGSAGDRTAMTQWEGDLAPITASEWNYEHAAHLLERAGFGGTPEDVARLAALSPEDAVSFLIDWERVANDHLQDFDHSDIFRAGMIEVPRSRAQAVRDARRDGETLGVMIKPGGSRPLQPVVNAFFYILNADRLEIRRLSRWWGERMVLTERPLQEKLALFWHGHFATGNVKVRDYRKMLQQLELFHARGKGSLRDLLRGVATDPAMLVYLDAGQNVRGNPNENFAREILELFTLGPGNYTEADIREAARAFTGWTHDPHTLSFVVNADQHDTDPKTFLGHTGNFDGYDIIDLILQQPATARFLAGKMYRYFVRDRGGEAVVDALANAYRESDYDTAGLLRTIFLSRDFYAPASVGSLIKSPVQMVVGTYRKLGLAELPGVPDFHETTERLGQRLFEPPNVAGWAGGRAWITSATLLDRGNFGRQLLFPDMFAFRSPDPLYSDTLVKVGAKIAAGAEITQATVQGESMAMEMAASDEAYNTRYASWHGHSEAMRVVKPARDDAAQLDVLALVDGLETSEEVVDALCQRLLRRPLAEPDRLALVQFLDDELAGASLGEATSWIREPLRLLVHLVLSTPEYQLS